VEIEIKEDKQGLLTSKLNTARSNRPILLKNVLEPFFENVVPGHKLFQHQHLAEYDAAWTAQLYPRCWDLLPTTRPIAWELKGWHDFEPEHRFRR